MRRTLVLTGWMLMTGGAWGANISASLETKFQVDNRFNASPRFLGELWGDAEILSTQSDWRAHFSWAGRLSSLSDDSGGKLYQAFVEKHWKFLQSAVRLGRFQRADLSGLYFLDGGQLDYRIGDWRMQWYGGRPMRADNVRSLEGDSVHGVRLGYDRTVHRRWGALTWERYRFNAEYQAFRNNGLSRRLQGAASLQGRIGDRRSWESTLTATYRFDRARFEDVWFSGFVDLTATLRFRTHYEYYRPRSPFPSFRERFTSAYALEEQSLFRAELHHRPTARLHYFIGGQRATKADGFDGFGIRGGGDYRWRDSTFALTWDYLEIGADRAHSGYARIVQAIDSRLEIWANAAVRREEKLLYGVNWARGGETGFRFLLDGNWVILTSLSYIANSRRKDDYVGAVRVIYYLDRFQPKGKTCAWLC